jgi:hypothetical protein
MACASKLRGITMSHNEELSGSVTWALVKQSFSWVNYQPPTPQLIFMYIIHSPVRSIMLDSLFL